MTATIMIVSFIGSLVFLDEIFEFFSQHLLQKVNALNVPLVVLVHIHWLGSN